MTTITATPSAPAPAPRSMGGLAAVAASRPVTAAVVGATGYAGGELIRLLHGHPGVELVGLAARGRMGEPLAASHPHLSGLGRSVVDAVADADVVLLALPHGAAAELVPQLVASGRTVLDLGADFRLRDPMGYPTWYGWSHPAPELLEEAVYGLPELHRAELAELGHAPGGIVAVPGCYPTAAILAVAPLARAGLIGDLVVDAKSGASGAGREPRADLAFAEVNESVRAYGVAGHRHAAEMIQELGALEPAAGHVAGEAHPVGAVAGLEFVPHLIPMTRGILATCYVRASRAIGEGALAALYEAAYGHEPFVQVVDEPPATKHVLGSNDARVFVRLQPRTGRIVAMAVIDNLVKGAAGQAVQALNIVCGYDERAGLGALPVNP